MNFKSISYYLSFFCFPISILSFVNILYSSYFDYFLAVDSYVITLFISIAIGSGFYFIGKKSEKRINFIEQLTLIIFVYIFISIFIALPLYFSNYQITFVNSLFEAFSGVTGTGFSIFKNIKYLDPTLILWRSSSQWIGGLYFLIFLIIVFSNKKFKIKMNDLTFSDNGSVNLEDNIKSLVIKIFLIYVCLSVLIFFLLNISQIRLFNSLNLTMTLISNGGFLPTNLLSQIIQTNSQKIVFILSLIITMINFFFIVNIPNKRVIINEHKEDFYLIILSVLLTLILFLYFKDYGILNIIIAVLSSLSNSGLSLINSDNNLILYFLLLTLIGGSLISNSSGIKLARIFILLKTTSFEIIKLISPNNVINKNIFSSQKVITDEYIKISFLIFISFFISLFILSSLLIIDNISFEKSFKLSILTITNTYNSEMFGLENLDFKNLLTTSKIGLIIFMIIGKIELISIFLIFKKIFLKD